MTDSQSSDGPEDPPPDEQPDELPLELGDSAIEQLSEDDSAIQRIPDLTALPEVSVPPVSEPESEEGDLDLGLGQWPLPEGDIEALSASNLQAVTDEDLARMGIPNLAEKGAGADGGEGEGEGGRGVEVEDEDEREVEVEDEAHGDDDRPPADLPDPEEIAASDDSLDPPVASLPPPNRTLGRYELVEELGSGGFGRVWRAESKGPLGFVEEVAVKVVHPALAASDERALLTLADEARILSRLRHPNIVGLRSFESVEDAGETHHILVLEFVRGVTLESVFQLLDRMGRAMPIAAILTLWDDALAGLDHAHNARGLQGEDLFLVHRDLKPPNLMIDQAGNLRILDFGIAWARERLVHTIVGTTKGSPPWMSPEQIRGDQVDARCDLWVLGSVMFRLVTGEYWVRPAKRREEAAEVLQALAKTKWEHRSKAVDTALGRGGRLPLKRKDRKLLEELLRVSLEHQLVKRAQTAAELRRQLSELSGWNPEDGRKVLSALSRGILKGQSAMASGVEETRAMKPVEHLTTPGSPIPKRPK